MYWQGRLNKKIFQFDLLIISAIVLFIVYIAFILLRPYQVFWSVDEAGKFIYLESVIRTGDPASPLFNPSNQWDPDQNFAPLYYFVRLGNQLFSWWPVSFPLLNLPFYKFFGWVGLYIIPAFFGVLTAYLSGRIIRLVYPKSKYIDLTVFWITALGTPIFFYSTMFWEHTISAACLVGSLYFILLALINNQLKWIWIAGLTASFSVLFRTETAGYFIGFGLILLIKKWKWAFSLLGGFIASTIPWMLFNQYAMGNIISRQLSSLINSSGSSLEKIGAKVFAFMLFNFPSPVSYTFSRPLLTAGCFFVLIAIFFVFIKKTRLFAAISVFGLGIVCATVLFSTQGYTFLSGFLIMSPFLVFAAWILVVPAFWKRSSLPLLILAGSLSFLLIFISRAWFNAGGLQWGPRYLIGLYPLLVILSIFSLKELFPTFSKSLKFLVIFGYLFCLCIGIGFEIRGEVVVWQNNYYYGKSGEELIKIKSTPAIIECKHPIMLIPNIYFSGNFLYVAPDRTNEWLKIAKSQNILTYTLVDTDLCKWIQLDDLALLRKENINGINTMIQEVNIP